MKDPEGTTLGRKIISQGIPLMNETGFEDFTFKKLAAAIGTTEASIYRYFENKHRLLIYITNWFWTWMEYQLIFQTNNIAAHDERIGIIIKLLTSQETNTSVSGQIEQQAIRQIAIVEGNKCYLNKQVRKDNVEMLFKPYEDLCHRIADMFLAYSPNYPFAKSLANTLIETAHRQQYFEEHLPPLTNFHSPNDAYKLADFLTNMVFASLDNLP
ncbi:MAG: TetR/AcrR family transcriptional regulator [Dyadobacter sp.]